MTHDPYDIDNRATTDRPTAEDPYVRRPYRSAYGGSGIAFVIFGVVAVLLIGFAMFGGYSNDTAMAPQTTAQQQAPVVQPAAPQPAAPSTTNQ